MLFGGNVPEHAPHMKRVFQCIYDWLRRTTDLINVLAELRDLAIDCKSTHE